MTTNAFFTHLSPPTRECTVIKLELTDSVSKTHRNVLLGSAQQPKVMMANTKTKNFVLRTHVMLNHFLGKNKIEKKLKS